MDEEKNSLTFWAWSVAVATHCWRVISCSGWCCCVAGSRGGWAHRQVEACSSALNSEESSYVSAQHMTMASYLVISSCIIFSPLVMWVVLYRVPACGSRIRVKGFSWNVSWGDGLIPQLPNWPRIEKQNLNKTSTNWYIRLTQGLCSTTGCFTVSVPFETPITFGLGWKMWWTSDGIVLAKRAPENQFATSIFITHFSWWNLITFR